MFARLAPDYDRLNGVLTFGLVDGWRSALVRGARVRAGETVLDVCCGTGRLLEEIRRHVGPAGTAAGIDFTPGMLERASGLRVLGDALLLPFRDATFDATLSAFALRDVADQRRLLEEMGRVTRPGGRVGVLEIGPPTRKPFRLGFDLWFRGAVPTIASWFGQGESHRFLVRSLEYLPSREELARAMHAIGLRPVRERDLMLGAARMTIAQREASWPEGPPPAGYG